MNRNRHRKLETRTQVVWTTRLPRSGGPSCCGGPSPRCRQRSRLYRAMDQTSAATGEAAIEKSVTSFSMSTIVLAAATPIRWAGTKIENSSRAIVITTQIPKIALTGDRCPGRGTASGAGATAVCAIGLLTPLSRCRNPARAWSADLQGAVHVAHRGHRAAESLVLGPAGVLAVPHVGARCA